MRIAGITKWDIGNYTKLKCRPSSTGGLFPSCPHTKEMTYFKIVAMFNSAPDFEGDFGIKNLLVF